MRSAYLELLFKEMQQAAATALVFILLIVAWLVFLTTRVGVWPSPLPFGLAVATLGFVPFWALWRTFYSFRQEWNGDHMYLLLSLPVPGWYATSTKLVVAMVELFVYSGIILTGSLLLLSADGLAGFPVDVLREPAVFATAIKGALVQTLGLVIIMIIIQFAYLFGRIVSRRKGLMTMLAGVISLWFVFRVGGLIAPLLDWIPPVTMHGMTIQNGLVDAHTVYLGVAPVLGSLIAALVLFVVGSNMLERDIEL